MRPCLAGPRGSALGWECRDEPSTEVDPSGQLTRSSNVLAVEAEPSAHRATAHLGEPGRGRGDRVVGAVGVYAHHEATLSTRDDRHVAPDQKCQTTEHLPFRYSRVAGQLVSDTVGEPFVVGHRSRADGAERAAPYPGALTDSPFPLRQGSPGRGSQR